jgi:radical SAM superfamily enzyme YgiQ (UPF0313 family)
LAEKRPKYYLTQVTAPTLTNDMYGVFLAKAKGAKTIAFGTHVTPNTVNTLTDFPALDFVLRGEPELSLRELVDALDGKTGHNEMMEGLMQKADPTRTPIPAEMVARGDFSSVRDRNPPSNPIDPSSPILTCRYLCHRCRWIVTYLIRGPFFFVPSRLPRRLQASAYVSYNYAVRTARLKIWPNLDIKN